MIMHGLKTVTPRVALTVARSAFVLLAFHVRAALATPLTNFENQTILSRFFEPMSLIFPPDGRILIPPRTPPDRHAGFDSAIVGPHSGQAAWSAPRRS